MRTIRNSSLSSVPHSRKEYLSPVTMKSIPRKKVPMFIKAMRSPNKTRNPPGGKKKVDGIPPQTEKMILIDNIHIPTSFVHPFLLIPELSEQLSIGVDHHR